MIKYDFKTFMNIAGTNDYQDKIHKIKEKLNKKCDGEIFLDVNKCISKKELKRINEISSYVSKNADVFIVVGIGGSYMGSKALIELFQNKSNVEILFAGYSLSSDYLANLIDYIKDKRVVINVVSKSGNTIETNLIFSKLLEVMKEKYSKKELSKRIIVTTYNPKGKLMEIGKKNHFNILKMPNISGRYSILTISTLLPISIAGINIDKLISGYEKGDMDKSFVYAVLRDILYKNGKKIEAFTIYDERLLYFVEWLKQLFAETQGKKKKGIMPIGVFNTRDMHSLGQYLNDGEDFFFSTVINIVNNKDVLIKNKSLNKINNIVMLSIAKSLDAPSIIINMDKLTEENIGRLLYFFMTSAAIGAYLMGVSPYTQDGVLKYKRMIKEDIKCIK